MRERDKTIILVLSYLILHKRIGVGRSSFFFRLYPSVYIHYYVITYYVSYHDICMIGYISNNRLSPRLSFFSLPHSLFSLSPTLGLHFRWEVQKKEQKKN